jgi:hypothetical protein
MTNSNRKAAIRARMARTGENYTTARRAVAQARGHRPERVSPQDDLALERAVYAAYDQGTVAGFLAQELYSTATWRESKAAEHPGDDRNLRAAEHLAGLARQVLALPGEDPRILRMEHAVQAIADANGELPATSEITRTIGFGWYPSLDELLDRYAQEHTRDLDQLKQYVTSAEGEGVMSAARRISEALNIGLDEVLAAIQKLGSRAPAATLSGSGTLTAGAPFAAAASLSGHGTLTAGAPFAGAATLSGHGTLTAGAPAAVATATALPPTVRVTSADAVAAADGSGAVRQIDVDELSEQASRGGLARLNANQRILIAVILIAAVFPALPPETRQAILDDTGLAAAIATVLVLLKR